MKSISSEWLFFFLIVFGFVYILWGISKLSRYQGTALLSDPRPIIYFLAELFAMTGFVIVGIYCSQNLNWKDPFARDAEPWWYQTTPYEHIMMHPGFLSVMTSLLVGIHLLSQMLGLQWFEMPLTRIYVGFLWFVFLCSWLELFTMLVSGRSIVHIASDTWQPILSRPPPILGTNKDEEEPEVYHIPNQLFTYPEASLLCERNGATLATQEQMEKAYYDGADWKGSFGWSENKLALYPTQDPQKPGLFGGKIEDADLYLGVNCYGKKPKPTSIEQEVMDQRKLANRGISKLSKLKVDYARDHKDKYMQIYSFNLDKWNV